MVDRRSEIDAFDEIGRSFVDPVDARDFRRGDGIVAKKHPNVPLHFSHRVAAHMDPFGSERLARHEGRDCGATSPGVEAPTVVAAFDLVPVKMAGAERHPAMRAGVAQRERRTSRVATDQDRFAKHYFCQSRPAPQTPARHRVVPGLAQRRAGVLRRRCRSGIAQKRVESQMAIREPALTAAPIRS